MLKIIAAVAENGVIGRENSLPWRLSDDMTWFKEKTGSDPVFMGSKTYHSLPERFRPLPGRENIVLTRQLHDWIDDPVTLVSDIDAVIKRAKTEDIWVIGGANIYRELLPFADEIYLTRVHGTPKGDVFFPKWNPDEWTRVYSKQLVERGRNEFQLTWEVYRRRTARWIEMANIRDITQSKDMQEILELKVCPFCIENFHRWHTKPTLWRGGHWLVTENKYPYKSAKSVTHIDIDGNVFEGKLHLMMVLLTHAETAGSIPPGAWEEIGTIVRWAENRYNIEGGGFYMRFGEPVWTGGTIRHIHAHIVQRKDLETPSVFYLSQYVPLLVDVKAGS